MPNHKNEIDSWVTHLGNLIFVMRYVSQVHLIEKNNFNSPQKPGATLLPEGWVINDKSTSILANPTIGWNNTTTSEYEVQNGNKQNMKM